MIDMVKNGKLFFILFKIELYEMQRYSLLLFM